MNNKKTILYLITQSEFGGAQKYVLDLAMGLKDEFNICVGMGSPRCSSRLAFASAKRAGEAGGEGEKGEFARKLKENNIKYYIIKHLKREISPISDFLAIFEIRKLIKKIKPDIVHLNSSKISILGSIASQICFMFHVSCYVIYTVHGWVFNEPLAKWKKSFYFFAEKLTAKLKNTIICLSKPDYDIAKNKLKIKEKKLSLIYHGIKPINFLSREEARRKLISHINNSSIDIRQSTFLVATIANLYKTKGLEYLVEAVRILTTYNLQLTTVIIGEGEERKNLEDLIGQLNLKNRVFLVGSIKNAAHLLPAFDIYINSSVKEGFPYSILEAMSAGLAVVATKVGGIPEMISDGENGLLAEPANPEELAKRIKILVEDNTLRSVLGEQAKKNIEEKFKIEKMIEKTKKIYQK